MYRIVVDPAVMVDRIGNRSPVLDEFLAFSLRLFEAVQVLVEQLVGDRERSVCVEPAVAFAEPSA